LADQTIEFSSFPKDLAEQVRSVWPSLESSVYTPPALPSDRQLRYIIETAFLASMETDESKEILFTLCCIPSAERGYPGKETTKDTIVFEKARPFNSQEIRRLTAAIGSDSCVIWVYFPEQADTRPVIIGLMNNQAPLLQPPDFFQKPGIAIPHALLIRVDGPGRVSVYQGEFPIASLKRGRILTGGLMPAMDLSGAHRLFDQSQKILSDKIIRPENIPPLKWSEIEWFSIAATIRAIISSIQSSGLGGTLIFIQVDCDISEKVLIKYPLATGSSNLAQRVVSYINASHQLESLKSMAQRGTKTAPDEKKLDLMESRMKDSLSRLQETCIFIGGLAATDGALILRTDFSVEGFGAEIRVSGISGNTAGDIRRGSEDNSTRPLDIQQYGMRHRSAMRLCAAEPGLVIFVISQDGDISIVYQENGETRFKSGIKPSSQNGAFTLLT